MQREGVWRQCVCSPSDRCATTSPARGGGRVLQAPKTDAPFFRLVGVEAHRFAHAFALLVQQRPRVGFGEDAGSISNRRRSIASAQRIHDAIKACAARVSVCSAATSSGAPNSA